MIHTVIGLVTDFILLLFLPYAIAGSGVAAFAWVRMHVRAQTYAYARVNLLYYLRLPTQKEGLVCETR